MKILFTVCGRAGSKGLSNKNIKEFLGFPLSYYTLSVIELFQKVHIEDDIEIALNTDSKELKEIVEKYNLSNMNYIDRKYDLAGDNVSKIDVIRDTYNEMNIQGKVFDIIIDLDLTSPLRKLEDLENLIKENEKNKYDIIFSVTHARRNPYFNMVKLEDGIITRVIESNIITRQAAPEVFDMNASMYLYRPEFLENTQSIFDGKCGIIHMEDTAVLDIDCENDFMLLELLAGYYYKNNDKFVEIFDNIKRNVE